MKSWRRASSECDAQHSTAASQCVLFSSPSHSPLPIPLNRYKMKITDEEAEVEEPPSADSDSSKRAEAAMAKLAGAIHQAQAVEAMVEVVELGECELSHLSAESDLRKSLLLPKESVAEDGTPCWTQHNGSKTYSAVEDLQFRSTFWTPRSRGLASGTPGRLRLRGQQARI